MLTHLSGFVLWDCLYTQVKWYWKVNGRIKVFITISGVSPSALSQWTSVRHTPCNTTYSPPALSQWTSVRYTPCNTTYSPSALSQWTSVRHTSCKEHSTVPRPAHSSGVDASSQNPQSTAKISTGPISIALIDRWKCIWQLLKTVSIILLCYKVNVMILRLVTTTNVYLWLNLRSSSKHEYSETCL